MSERKAPIPDIPSRFGIGARAPRVEDRRLLTGEGRFGDDVTLPGQLHAVFVTSPEPAGRIARLDLATARAMPGVRGAFGAADLDADGIGDLPCIVARIAPLKRGDGTPIFVPPRPPLARDAVRFVGDIVAMVIADSIHAARDAAETVELEIDSADAVMSPVAAAAPGAPAVWDDCADNTAYVFRAGDAVAVDAALATAPLVAEVEIPFTRIAMSPMEPRHATGAYDRRDGCYVLHCGTQNPHFVRRALAADILHVPETDVRIVTPDMGGAFGMRSNVFPEMVLVLWAARRLGQPVKWTGTRSDAFLTDDMGRDLVMQATLGMETDGTFRALRVRSTAALGAYLSLFGPIPTFSNLGGLAGVYRTPLISAEVRAVFTNAPPIAPYRGAGRPEAIACIEACIDAIARTSGMDRLELRRCNMIRPDEMPFHTGLGYVYDSGDFPASMARAETLSDLDGFEARRAKAARQGRLRGIALVNAIEAAAGTMDEGAEIRIEADGSATVLVGAVNHGQGQETTLAQVVAQTVPVPFERVRVRYGDTAQVPYGRGSFASRTAALAGSAVLRSAEAVRTRSIEIAAHLLGVEDDVVEIDDATFRAVSTNRTLSWAQVAEAAHTPPMLPKGMTAGLSATRTFNADHGPTFPNGCHVCEVEIDGETGALEIVNYVVVDDVGTVLNPMIIEGQIHGGIVQGLSQVMAERMVHDADTGQPLTGSFMDYAMPRAADMPFFVNESNPHPTPHNPLGAKGAGEAGTVGALPAALLAVQDALAPLGIHWIDMPASPGRIWALIDEARRARG